MSLLEPNITETMNESEANAVSHFGVHLTIDGYHGDKEALGDEGKIREILRELPVKLKMHAIADPLVVNVDQLSEKDPGGISGVVLIAESHISLHTFPKRGFVSADVYTCQNELDQETALSYLKEMFGLQDLETNYIIRGTRYPQGNIY
jgi:S-adenosylmethionine decarboxylase